MLAPLCLMCFSVIVAGADETCAQNTLPEPNTESGVSMLQAKREVSSDSFYGENDLGKGTALKVSSDRSCEKLLADRKASFLQLKAEKGIQRQDGFGATAALNAQGFRDVTSMCCPSEMESFFNRLLSEHGYDVCSKRHVQGLMHWFTCVPEMDFQYVLDVIANGNPCKYWTESGQTCPTLSAECMGHWCDGASVTADAATQTPTSPPTVPPTSPPTVPPTSPPTVPPTSPPTVPPTSPPTSPPTAPPTLPPTEPPIETTTEKPEETTTEGGPCAGVTFTSGGAGACQTASGPTDNRQDTIQNVDFATVKDVCKQRCCAAEACIGYTVRDGAGESSGTIDGTVPTGTETVTHPNCIRYIATDTQFVATITSGDSIDPKKECFVRA